MQIRKVQAEEWVQFKKIQSIAFLFPIDVPSSEKRVRENPEQLYLDCNWGAFTDSGQLVSGMTNGPYAMYYDGHTVGMGGIGGVATLPEHRIHGSVRAIVKQIFMDMREKGDLFSVLFPFSHRFYRQFGYEVCHAAQVYKFPTKELSSYHLKGTVRMHAQGEPDDAFRRIYEQFASRYTYAVCRNDYAWQRILRGDPFKSELYSYILSREGEDVAYCLIQPIKIAENENDMHLVDFAYIDKEALHDLFGFLYRLSPQFQHVRMEPPSDLALSSLLEEPDTLSTLREVHTMARVVDVKKALQLMRHPSGKGSYRIAVRDDMIQENNGVYDVVYQDGSIVVTQYDIAAACDITVSVQTFAQLCFGFLSLPMALLKQDVQLFGNQDTLERVFIVKPKFFSDRF